ncbi:MAG: FkbM family methyltransferase [Phycisphaerales bacterium]
MHVQLNLAVDSTFDAAYARFALRRRPIGTVIDVGASNGSWTGLSYRHFPGAKWLLIEGLPAHEEILSQFVNQAPNIQYEMVLAGNRDGEAHLFLGPDNFGGAAHSRASEGQTVPRPMRSIDSLVAQHKLPGPYFIKLDTHGFEREILEGARETLKGTNLVLLEVYNFELGPGIARFAEMCAHMETLGFRCVDVVDPLRRTSDGALWQWICCLSRSRRPCSSGRSGSGNCPLCPHRCFCLFPSAIMRCFGNKTAYFHSVFIVFL